MKTLLTTACALGALTLGGLSLGGCVTAAAAGVGVVFSQDFVEGANSVYLEEDADVVWQATKDALDMMSRDPVKKDEQTRAATAIWGGSSVAVHVQALDINDTKLVVGASKFGMYDDEVAQNVIQRIRRRLER